MSITLVRKAQIRNLNISRSDINTTTTGSALITKLIAGTGLTLSSTGVDLGTGDVTVALSIATASTLGGVKIGAGLTVAVDGTISVTNANTTWGSIFGNLDDQSDLRDALNAKYNVPTGTTSQYIDGTGAYQTFPTTLSTGYVRHEVKAGVAINKGQAVYVSSSDGTNMIVGLASNNSEATSSKTMGLLEATVAINGKANVVTEGLLAGLDTSTATAGDPVWLGINGNLIYGLANKPYAPKHLVFIGIVTRVNSNNGEIFVKVQNGFELDELHDVDLKTTTPLNGHILGYNGTLWVNKTIANWLGYIPQNAATAITTSNIGSQSVNYATSAGSASTSSSSTESTRLLREDNRTISPSELLAGYLKFGFTSWRNDGTSPYADFLHMRSYTDSSGGTDNLIMFLKSGIGMRIWQQTWGSTSPYAEYVDVWTTGNFTQTSVNNWNTAFSWGNHAGLYALASHTHAYLPLSGGTITGKIIFNTASVDNGFEWIVNSDSAGITFKNTGDGDSNSNFNFFTKDNGNEYFKFSHTHYLTGSKDYLDIKDAVARFNGNIYVNASQSGDRTAGTNALTGGNLVWHSGDFSSTNVTNWNTAYSWGNHALSGYATQTYVNDAISNLIDSSPDTLNTLNELAAALGDDPNFATTVAGSIAAKLPLAGGTMTGQILTVSIGGGTYDGAIQIRETGYVSSSQSAWAYSPAITFHWGNRYAKRFGMRSDGLFAVDDEPLALRSWVQGQGYITGYTETDPTVPAHVKTITTTNISNWNAAYGWGNHATAGYLTSYSETDTLASVTARGATTTTTLTLTRTDITNIYVGNAIYFGGGNNYLNWTSGRIYSNVGIESASNMRAPIFYDSDDITYYVDANDISHLNISRTALRAHKDMSGYGVGNWVSDFERTPVSSMTFGQDKYDGGPSGTWWFQVNMRHNNGNDLWGTQLAYGWEDNANEIYQRNVTGGNWSSWVRYINTSNYAGILDGRYQQSSTAITTSNIASQSVNYAASAGVANSVAWTNVSGRPTALSQFTNDLGNYGGWITSYTETDTLASVTARGATTSTASVFRGGLYGQKAQTVNNYTTAALWTESYDNTTTGIAFHISGVVGKFLEMRTDGILYWEDRKVWTAGTLTAVSQLSNDSGYLTSLPSHNHDDRYYTESESDTRFATAGHTHDLMRYSLRAPGNVDSLTSANFREQLFGTTANGWTISTARWNTAPTGLSGMNSYGTMFAWSGSDTHGFIATDYSTANVQVGGGNGNAINWKATLIHSLNIGSYALTSYTETDTLNSVTTRGATTTNAISVGGLTVTERDIDVITTQGRFQVYNASRTGNLGYRIQTDEQGGWRWQFVDGGNNEYFGVDYPSGDLLARGTITEQSSLRYKENIIALESITDKVDRLRPVRYNKIGNTNTEIGLIAEEVAEIFPEFVSYNAKGEVESLNYTRLSVVLLQTVKELSDKINKLETK